MDEHIKGGWRGRPTIGSVQRGRTPYTKNYRMQKQGKQPILTEGEVGVGAIARDNKVTVVFSVGTFLERRCGSASEVEELACVEGH